MSRMLAWVAPTPSDTTTATGADTLSAFADLSRVHADGWGAAWRAAGTVSACVATGRRATAAELASAVPVRSSAALLYLRFGSAGTGTSEAEAQPFLRAGCAFQHNGALAPSTLLRERLTDDERARLRGGNDSELYFARVRRAIPPDGDIDPSALADAVAAVRALYPDACLNALLLTPSAVVAVQSSAGRPAPLAAFAARGIAPTDLPPGHDDGYNRLYTRQTPSGARVVATTGIPLDGWTPLPDDTVTLLTPYATTSVPLPSPV